MAPELAILLLSTLIFIGIGSIVGILFGLIVGWLLMRVTFHEKGLFPIFVLTCVLVATLGSELLEGNRLMNLDWK